jgi:hypothetical protein
VTGERTAEGGTRWHQQLQQLGDTMDYNSTNPGASKSDFITFPNELLTLKTGERVPQTTTLSNATLESLAIILNQCYS